MSIVAASASRAGEAHETIPDISRIENSTKQHLEQTGNITVRPTPRSELPDAQDETPNESSIKATAEAGVRANMANHHGVKEEATEENVITDIANFTSGNAASGE